jgi:hypothetical protein
MLLRNRNSAIKILFEVRNLRALLRQFLAFFGCGIWSIHKKSEVKNLVQLSLSHKFFISHEKDSSKNIVG